MQFIKITEYDFDELKRLHLLTGVSDLSTSFGISIEIAKKITEDQFHQSLPNGFETKEHYFYFIKDDSGELLGHIWFCVRDFFGVQKIFLNDIRIDEACRGRGFGKESMAWLEGKAKDLGFHEIALHVYGCNGTARKLYENLDFVPTSIHMSKKL